MTTCYDCAIKKGLKPKSGAVGMWSGVCPHCQKQKYLSDEGHDYIDPNAKRLTKNQAYALLIKSKEKK